MKVSECAMNVRRCLPEDSLVYTSSGLIKIKNIKIGMEALTTQGYKKIVAKFEQGKQQLVKITTQDGEFECTPNHRMAVLKSPIEYEWKEASQLLPSDRLMTSRVAISGVKTYLPDWHYEKTNHSTTCKDIIIPELDTEMAWFIGTFQGNGNTYVNFAKNGFNAYVSVVTAYYNIAERAQKQMQRFGTHVTCEKRKTENSYIVRSQSKQLAWYFHQIIKQAKTTIRTPEYILQAEPDIRLAYVAGVTDADGCMKNRPKQVVSTVYKEFAKDIQNVLYSCGIESRFNVLSRGKSRLPHWKQLYGISLSTMHSQQVFSKIPELYKVPILPVKAQNTNGYPVGWMSGAIKRKHGLYGPRKQIPIDTYCKETSTTSIWCPIEVLSVAPSTVQPTYDIEVADQHEFFCEGYLTHNSAQIALGSAKDLEFIRAKRWDLGDIPQTRCYSNNTVICNDINELLENDEFWQGYHGNGEPYGIFNLDLTRKCGRTGETQYADPSVEGTNPCSEQSLANHETCVTGDTRIHTRNHGCPYIKDVVGQEVEIFNGEEWSKVTPFKAQDEDTFLKITFSDGSILKCTPTHEFSICNTERKVKASELSVGLYIPTFTLDTSSIDVEDDILASRMGEAMRELPIEHCGISKLKRLLCVQKPTNGEYFTNPLTGLPNRIMNFSKKSILDFTAECVNAGVRIKENGKYFTIRGYELKLRDLQILLRRANINNTLLEKTNNLWTLQISLFETKETPAISLQHIIAIEECPNQEPSYCFSEPLRHMGVFGNVLTYQCCLAELYLPRIQSKEELFTMSKYLYRICKHSLALPCKTSELTEEIVHKNMRMGIGVTGYLQATEDQRNWLSDCYEFLRSFDATYSKRHKFPTSVKICTTKPSGCSRGDSLLQTNKGLLRLDEIGDITGVQWQQIDDLYVTTDTNKTEKITKFYVNGHVPTKIITTADGLEMESSLNHRYRVVNNEGEYVWKTVDTLTVGDRLAVKLGDHPNDIRTPLDTIILSNNTNSQVMKQPEFLTQDIAWFLGLFYGDGSVHAKGIRISFNRKHPELVRWLINFFKDTFDLRTTVDDERAFYVNSQQFLQWLKHHKCLKDYSHEIHVPAIIRASSKDNVLAFIDGFWRADGGIHNMSTWSICSVSKRFAQELLCLCRSVGFNVKVKNCGPGGLGSKDRWIITNRNIGTSEFLFRTGKASDTLQYTSKILRQRVWKDYWLDPIESIQDSHCDTYDIEVENAHHYRIGGVISHNTLSLLGGVTSGCHPAFSQYYIRRIRIASGHPLVALAKSYGYHLEYLKNQDGTFEQSRSTMVIEFPYKLPDHTITAAKCTAIDQLEIVKRLQREWSDNAVSCTVYYRLEELPGIKDWLRENYNNSVKAISFLLHSGHGFLQAPLEEITKEQYDEMVRNTKKIDSYEGICYHISNEDDDTLTGECAGGACPIK